MVMQRIINNLVSFGTKFILYTNYKHEQTDFVPVDIIIHNVK